MSEIVSVDKGDPQTSALRKATEAIERGELVIYPTETVYGLAADASSDEAVAKVFKAKSRPLKNPIPVAVDSLSMAFHVGKITRREEDLIREFLPGPLTLVVESRPSVSDMLSAGTGNIGVRIPDNSVALGLIKFFGGPVTSTSANISGAPAPTDVDEALNQLGEKVELALDAGRSPGGKPSTVVKVSDDDVQIIREGPIPKSDILSALR